MTSKAMLAAANSWPCSLGLVHHEAKPTCVWHELSSALFVHCNDFFCALQTPVCLYPRPYNTSKSLPATSRRVHCQPPVIALRWPTPPLCLLPNVLSLLL